MKSLFEIVLIVLILYVVLLESIVFGLAPESNISYILLLQNQGIETTRTYTYPAGNIDIKVKNPNKNYWKTSAGTVSVGMSMLARLLYPEAKDYPDIFIAPEKWNGADGTNIMQIYFAISCNFFIYKRKTKIVCKPEQIEKIKEYLKLGNPYYLPDTGYLNKDIIKRFRKEALYLADRAEVEGQLKMVNPSFDMVEFIPFSKVGKASVGNVVIKEQEDGDFLINDKGEDFEIILQGRDIEEYEVKIMNSKPLSEIPELGVTFLGTSSGLDSAGLPSNHVIWAGEQSILLDLIRLQ